MDRAVQLERRKEIYEVKYPETKHGMRNGQTSKTPTVGVLENKPSFVKDTSDKTGKSQSTIFSDIQIAKASPRGDFWIQNT